MSEGGRDAAGRAGGLTGPHEALLWALIEAAERLDMSDAEADRLERAIIAGEAPAAA